MKLKFFIVVFGLLISIAPASAANCLVPFFQTPDNQTSAGAMYAVSGRPCSVTLARSAGPIFATQLTEKARNGSVTVSVNKLVYTSRPGFVGEDRFSYTRRGLSSRNSPIMRTVNMTVQVTAEAR